MREAPAAPGRLRTAAAGVLSGLLLALAFPPVGWVALLPLAPVPWLVALAGERGRGRALWSGFLFGLAFWCASIPWIAYVVTNFGGQSGWMGIVCLALTAAILSPWPALVAWTMVSAAPAGSARRLALFPLLWMASEHARANFYPAFPWNLCAFALYRHPIWLQTASVFGAYGVGLLVMGAAALLAGAVFWRKAAPAAGAALVVLAAGLFGALRLARPAPGGQPVRTALVQPGISQEERLDPNASAATYAAVVGQAREAAGHAPDLIVLPESALPAHWDTSPELRRDLAEIAAACRCGVLFNDVETEPGGRYFNVARIATAQGLAGHPYRKVHLVPFGEYVPFPRLFFFVRQVSTAVGEFSAAPRAGLLEANRFRIGTSVCYEVTYEGLAREETALGANLLVTISNDSWYGKAGAQEQHFAGAVLRAVENGRWMLRAAVTGISGAADERGRIAGLLSPDTKGTLPVTARLQTEQTAWTRWGYRVPPVADVLAALVLVFGLVRRRVPKANP
ncbi:MAG: apolipoprotein N-acyltransferase [Thermoanaerobaculia bacterium]